MDAVVNYHGILNPDEQLLCEELGIDLEEFILSKQMEEVNNEQKTKKTLSGDLKKIVNNKNFSDVIFYVKDKLSNEYVPMYGLKAILGARCKVLYNLLYNGMIETTESKFYIDDETPHAFWCMLMYLYTSKIPNIEMENLASILYTSEKYIIPELGDACYNAYKNIHDINKKVDIMHLFQNMDSPNIEKIKSYVLEEIVENLLYYRDKKIFNSFSKHTMDIIYDLPISLFISEFEACIMLLEWIEIEAKREFLDVRKLHKEYMKKICFNNMTIEQLDKIKTYSCIPDVHIELFKKCAYNNCNISIPLPEYAQQSCRHYCTHKILTYDCDFDANGLIYLLGTDYNTKEFYPPIDKIIIKTYGLRKGRAINFIDRNNVNTFTYSHPKAYIRLDLGQNVILKLSSYTLKHGFTSNHDSLRNWKLNASNDGSNWDCLIEHVNDENLNGEFATHTWHIENDTYYRYFSINITGYTSGGNGTGNNYYITICGIELYGEVIYSTY